jgi:hypothetical protein
MKRTIGWTAGLAAVVLAVGGAGRADDAGDAKAIVEKAIKAAGGADVLKKYPAMTTKSKGTFYGMGDGVEYTGQEYTQLPDKLRLEIHAGDFKFTQVFNGDKGWIQAGDNTMDMPKEMVAELQEGMQLHVVMSLVPLLEGDYKLSPLAEVKVGGKPAVGVRVEHKGHRDVSLFFDKDSGLLVKTEHKGKDVQAGGAEYTAESFLSDYKKVDGLEVPFKVSVKRDGKRYIEAEVQEAKPSEKLEDKLFQKP